MQNPSEPRDAGAEHKCPISAHNLEQFVKFLTDQRDEHQGLLDANDNPLDAGKVSAYRLSLIALHIYTDGEYGQSLDEQSGGAS